MVIWAYSARERLLIFLMYVGCNPFDELSAYAHEISYGVVNESVKIVIDAIHDHFVDEWIRLPDKDEAMTEASHFTGTWPMSSLHELLQIINKQLTCQQFATILQRN